MTAEATAEVTAAVARRLRCCRAVSLMEAMIALTIFSWVVTSLFSVWAMHARTLSKSQDHMIAAALCEHMMEAQLSLGWTAETDNNPANALNVTHKAEGTPVTRSYHYAVETDITSASGADNLKHVSVTVTFKDEHDVERKITMHTLLSWQG